MAAPFYLAVHSGPWPPLLHDDYEGTTLRDHLGAPAQYGLDARLENPTE